MKKFITAVTAALLAFTFTGCGEKTENSEYENSASSEASTASSTPVSFDVLKPYMDYIEGFNTNDPERTLEAITPQIYINAIKEADKYDNLLEQNQRDITATIDYWKEQYGENTKISYISELNNTPLTAEQLDLANRCYKYTFYDVKATAEIIEGYEVTYTYKISGDLSSAENEETSCFLNFKDDGWKLLAVPASVLEQYKDSE